MLRKPKYIQQYEKAGCSGDTYAQCQLGAIYATGDDINRDLEKSVYWYSKAAALEHPEAIYNLGFMYLLGEGVPENTKIGMELMRQAAVLGDTDAQTMYGLSLAKGLYDLERDGEEAAYWYLRLLLQGCSSWLGEMAALIEEGYVTANDVSVAARRLSDAKTVGKLAPQDT